MRKLSTLTLLSVSALSLMLATPTFAKENENANNGVHGGVNFGLHLGQIKHTENDEDTHEVKHHTPTKTDILAYRAAVKKAQADYNAAKEKARLAYLAALKAARDQFLNPTSTPTTTINLAPTVATAAAVNASPVTGTNANLSVLGADDNGEANLTYSWNVVAKPAGASDPTFSANNSNAAKNTTATFSQAGTYQFVVTITDAGNLNTSSSVNVTVNQTLSNVNVLPVTSTIGVTSTLQLSATSTDQFNNPVTSGFNWTILEGVLGGSVNSSGLYTAPAVTGTFHVVATSNVDATKNGSSAITVVSQ